MTPSLVAHLEQYAGRIRDGWTKDADGQPVPFQVVLLDNSARPECTTYATLGLSNIALQSPRSDKKIRHELLMLSHFAETKWAVPGILQQVGLAALEHDRAYLRGDVLGPRGPICAESSMEALYVSAPSYFPDEFATCETAVGTVVLAWLIPIGANEAAYVRSHGWNAFEDRLVEEDPDVLDLRRPELAVCGG
jgi:hypothetical protein